MIVKQDLTARTLKIDPITSLVRVDGIILCKRVERCGVVYLQFKDGDRLRSQCRGTAFVEVPLEAFENALIAAHMEDDLRWPY
ncbi:MAG: hypothetical protein MUO64_19495 [Anaerolineales bacterium]|nr:hypothetical protein [Anaerolineales bacterium]